MSESPPKVEKWPCRSWNYIPWAGRGVAAGGGRGGNSKSETVRKVRSIESNLRRGKKGPSLRSLFVILRYVRFANRFRFPPQLLALFCVRFLLDLLLEIILFYTLVGHFLRLDLFVDAAPTVVALTVLLSLLLAAVYLSLLLLPTATVFLRTIIIVTMNITQQAANPSESFYMRVTATYRFFSFIVFD